MPTNRNKRTRKFKSPTISPAMLHFLATGDYCLKKKPLEILPREKFEIFQLGNPSCRDRVKKIWRQYRDEVMSDWEKRRKPGLPWAAREFR